MRNKVKRLGFGILAVLFMLTINIPIVSAHQTPVADSYDFGIDSVTVVSAIVREENDFTIGVSASYHAVNYGYWQPQPDLWVPCELCSETGSVVCTSCGGSGGEFKPRTVYCNRGNASPQASGPCRSECDGNDYQCGGCGETMSTAGGNHPDCPQGGDIVAESCNCPAGTEPRWEDCSPCRGSGNIRCRACNGAGGHFEPQPDLWIPPTRPSVGYSQLEFLINNVAQSYATKDIIIGISDENADTSEDGSGWAVWGNAYYEITLNAGENIGDKTVEARINWGYKSSETDSSNNSDTVQIDVIPATNLTVEYFEPNAYYRTDTEVITTYIIHNQDNIGALNIKPKHGLTAEFKAINPATNAVVASVSKTDIVIPEHGSNIVYFKWRIPADYPPSDIKLQCDINTTKVQGSIGVPGVNEMDYTDNQAVGINSVKSSKESQTPDTVFENRPSWFIKPTANDTAQFDAFASYLKDTADFEEWIWANNDYKKTAYSLKLEATMKLTSDVRNPTGKLIDDKWEIKSGYGFSIDGKTTFGNGGSAPVAAFTLPQSGNAHLPEYKFSSQNKKYRTLEQTSSGIFQLKQNSFAMNDKGQSENRRVHFTPLWYPDGEYKVAAYYYDCWTPVGMLSVIVEDKLTISGNMYDDWYVNHGGR